MFENAEVVAEGTWLYDGCVPCYLRIIKWDILYGSGDYYDSPEIRDDKEIECFYILFEDMLEKGRYSRGGGFLTLAEAMDDAEKATFQKINWSRISSS